MAEANRRGKSSNPLPEIPDKLYFRIGEVARLLDLEPYVLRFWESEFPQLKPNKGGTGQRLFRRRDVETALEIRRLLYDEGYTIPGARQALKGEARGPRAVPVKAVKEPQPIRPLEEAPALAAPTLAALRDEAGATGRLRRMKAELREIADLLGRPSPGARSKPNPAHRGLQITSRRRSVPEAPSLFPEAAGLPESE